LIFKDQTPFRDTICEGARVVFSQEIGAAKDVQNSGQHLLEGIKSVLLRRQSWFQGAILVKVRSASQRNMFLGKGKQSLGVDILGQQVRARSQVLLGVCVVAQEREDLGEGFDHIGQNCAQRFTSSKDLVAASGEPHAIDAEKWEERSDSRR
jgi:hypothetical protein